MTEEKSVDQLLEEFRKDRRFMVTDEETFARAHANSLRSDRFPDIFGIVSKIAGGIAVGLTSFALENITSFLDAIRSIIYGAKIAIKVTCPSGLSMEVDSREKKWEKDLKKVVELCKSKP